MYLHVVVGHDTIRDASLTCDQKLTRISLIYTARNRQLNSGKQKKNKKTKKTDILISIGKQSEESVQSVGKQFYRTALGKRYGLKLP